MIITTIIIIRMIQIHIIIIIIPTRTVIQRVTARAPEQQRRVQMRARADPANMGGCTHCRDAEEPAAAGAVKEVDGGVRGANGDGELECVGGFFLVFFRR